MILIVLQDIIYKYQLIGYYLPIIPIVSFPRCLLASLDSNSKSPDECICFRTFKYSTKSSVASGLNQGSVVIFLSNDANLSFVIPFLVNTSQYLLRLPPLFKKAMIPSHITTSSGVVLLCSF